MPQITKAKFATSDLFRIKNLSVDTPESNGKMVFPVSGQILFDNVSFNYPSRKDVPVLQNVSFDIRAGECVGIVG